MRDMEVICMYVEFLTGINTQQAAGKAASPAPKAAKKERAAKAAEPGKKTESTDGDLGRQIQVAKESDDAVTLSITADDQLVDAQKNVNMDRLRKIMEQLSSALPNSEPKFGIHEKTNRITIKLIDRDTQEVVKEFPPEKSLDLLAKRMELAGVLLDEKW